ncbi:acyl-coenzyme A thioesterase 9, mitochondrial-like isoform X2 [Lycorma delicatula]|uniref:acyl-coenzyme A thioesterase 9, mitochondrial-like isoform X2 n=1 Tax=Lycorma delicatula TaxID=130591 RepID=UPI003F5165E6
MNGHNENNFHADNTKLTVSSFTIPENIPTVNQVKEDLRKKMGVQQGYHPILQNRSDLLKYLPVNQDELPPRSVKDSFSAAVIPLSKDTALQDKYVNFMGSVRLGRLMEDLDMFAVNIVFKHLLLPKQKGDVSPVVIVTILVDEISFGYKAKPNQDIRVCGHVSWVGSSSVEVTVWLEQNVYNTWVNMVKALFLMAVRNSTNTKGSFVNRITPANEEEKLIVMEAESRSKQRSSEVKMSLLKEPPTEEEKYIIHDMFLKTSDLRDVTLSRKILVENSKWMKDTELSNVLFSHPEDRNLHNKVFGGFLMRQALELAFMTAFVHCKLRPKLVYSSGITFHHPVDVGSLLQMSGKVTYTENRFMQITIYAEVLDPFTSKLTTTNVFHYTYESSNIVPSVFPATYSEAMMYIDSRRHFHSYLK